MLLAAGAEMDTPDLEGEYPLLKLFSGPTNSPLEDYQLEALALVLHPRVLANVDVNVQQPITLDTALHLAVQRRTPVAVALLIKRGALVNAKNSSGTAPLLVAANQWRAVLTVEQEMILAYLLDAPELDINVKGGSLERTALHQAVKIGCGKAVAMLKEHGARTELKDKRGHDVHAVLEHSKGLMKETGFNEIGALLLSNQSVPVRSFVKTAMNG